MILSPTLLVRDISFCCLCFLLCFPCFWVLVPSAGGIVLAPPTLPVFIGVISPLFARCLFFSPTDTLKPVTLTDCLWLRPSSDFDSSTSAWSLLVRKWTLTLFLTCTMSSGFLALDLLSVCSGLYWCVWMCKGECGLKDSISYLTSPLHLSFFPSSPKLTTRLVSYRTYSLTYSLVKPGEGTISSTAVNLAHPGKPY